MHQLQQTQAWEYLKSYWQWRVDSLRDQLETTSPERLARLQGAISELRLLVSDQDAEQLLNEFDSRFRPR